MVDTKKVNVEVTHASGGVIPAGAKPISYRARDEKETFIPTDGKPIPVDYRPKEGVIEVTRAAYGVESDSQTKINVPTFATHPAYIRVEGSLTRNLGDFNSARVAVMIEMPCYPEKSEVTRTYNTISTWLDEMIPAELDKATQTPNEE